MVTNISRLNLGIVTVDGQERLAVITLYSDAQTPLKIHQFTRENPKTIEMCKAIVQQILDKESAPKTAVSMDLFTGITLADNQSQPLNVTSVNEMKNLVDLLTHAPQFIKPRKDPVEEQVDFLKNLVLKLEKKTPDYTPQEEAFLNKFRTKHQLSPQDEIDLIIAMHHKVVKGGK